MAFTDSARKQFTAVVPDGPQQPTVPAHLQGIIDAVESQVVLKAATWVAADTDIAPYTDGMLLYVAEDSALYFRVGAAWSKLYPTSLSGTNAPDPALGSDGDLYFQTLT